MAETTNLGAIALTESTKDRGTQEELVLLMKADGLSVDASRVSRWRSDNLKPNTACRMWLQDHRGIGWQLWDQEVEKPGSGEHAAVTAEAGHTGTDGEPR